jgi:hypothetical protein
LLLRNFISTEEMIPLRKNLHARTLFFLATFFTLIPACKKSTSSPPVRSPEIRLAMPAARPAASSEPDEAAKAQRSAEFKSLVEKRYKGNPAEVKAVLEMAAQAKAQGEAEEKLAELHRRTMVVAAPPDFKPEPVARKVRLRLILEKSTLRSGERPRFRLEMRNVGREPIDYSEARASFFVKDASVNDSLIMHFYVLDSQSRRTELLPARPFQPDRPPYVEYLPDSMPQAEKEKWLKQTNALSAAHSTFKIKLLPGETLHSIGDDDSPRDFFRTLYTTAHFKKKPGTYRLQVELDDRPRPMSKTYIEANLRSGSTLEELQNDHDRWMKDALGPVSSNIESFEVSQ